MPNARDFLVQAHTRYLRERATFAIRPDRESLELAAHLYAVSCQVVEDRHSFRDLADIEHYSTLDELGTRDSNLLVSLLGSQALRFGLKGPGTHRNPVGLRRRGRC